MPDRRKSARRRTFLGGRISLDKIESFDVGCTVRNVSEGGVRIELDRDTLVPCAFRLAISSEAARRGRLIWYRAGEIGVAFGDVPAAEAPETMPPALPPLQVRMQAILARRHGAGSGFTRP